MHDLLIPFIFYFFAGLATLSAVMVVTQNNPVRCVLFLVLSFFAVAVLWLLMYAEFLALILILVYVGAVMTLFLFVVMMLNIDIESKSRHILRYLPFGLIIVALLLSLFFIAMPHDWYHADSIALGAKSISAVISNTQSIGLALYTDYVYSVELAAILLLVAIISAITLASRHKKDSKRQETIKQIMTNARDRIVLISMKSDK